MRSLANDHLFKKFRLKIVPVSNPDGYVLGHAESRVWRKYRNPSGCTENKFDEVDLNQNFPVDFKANSDACNATYLTFLSQI